MDGKFIQQLVHRRRQRNFETIVGGEAHVIIDNSKVGDELLKRTGRRGVDHSVKLVGWHASLKNSARGLKPNGKLCFGWHFA